MKPDAVLAPVFWRRMIPAVEKVRERLLRAVKALEDAKLLDALVQMELSAFQDKDCTHLRDLIEVGLLGSSNRDELPSELRERLQLLLDTPEG